MKTSAMRTFLLVSVSLLSYSAAQQPGWKHYRNDRWGFCLYYPSNWEADEGVNRAGIAIYPPQGRYSGPLAQISVGALYNQRSTKDRSKYENLADISQSTEAMFKEEGAKDMVVVRKDITVRGRPALLIDIRYQDAKTHSPWVYRGVTFKTADEVLYTLELQAPQRKLESMSKVFDAIKDRSFTVACDQAKSDHKRNDEVEHAKK